MYFINNNSNNEPIPKSKNIYILPPKRRGCCIHSRLHSTARIPFNFIA